MPDLLLDPVEEGRAEVDALGVGDSCTLDPTVGGRVPSDMYSKRFPVDMKKSPEERLMWLEAIFEKMSREECVCPNSKRIGRGRDR